MGNIAEEIREEAKTLLSSKIPSEKSEGVGMMKVIDELERYFYGFQEYDCYFDSICDEEKPLLNKRLQKLKIY